MTERYTDGFEDVGTNVKRPRRILIDDELDAIDAVDALKAPLASPTFTGTVTLPSGQILVAPVLGTPASGNLANCSGVMIQGTGGKQTVKAVAGAAAAGGAAAQSFTDAFCTTDSVVVGNWATQANAAHVVKIVPSDGSFVVTSSVDAGAGTFCYLIYK